MEIESLGRPTNAIYLAGMQNVLKAQLAEEIAWARRTMSCIGSLTKTPTSNKFISGRQMIVVEVEDDVALTFDVEEENEFSLSAALQQLALANM